MGHGVDDGFGHDFHRDFICPGRPDAAGEVGLGLTLALLVNGKIPGRRLVIPVLMMPYVLSTIVVTAIWRAWFHYDFGFLNNVLRAAEIPPVEWLFNPDIAMLSLAAAFPAANALVRVRFPTRLDMAFLVFVLLVKLTPPISLAIPLHQVLRALSLLDTLPGLIIVYQVYTLPFAIWMLLGFIRDVPVEYEEAALVDGGSLPRRLARIVVPVMMPGIIATAVFVMILAGMSSSTRSCSSSRHRSSRYPPSLRR